MIECCKNDTNLNHKLTLSLKIAILLHFVTLITMKQPFYPVFVL